MRHAVTAALIVLVAGASGCGSSGAKGSGGLPAPRHGATGGSERPAIERAVHRLVDRDDCSVMTDRFVGEGYATAAEGRAACESDTDPGLKAGQYAIRRVVVHNDQATVTLALKEGGTRTYGMVRDHGNWLADSVSERFVGRVGDTFTLHEAYEQDGVPVTVNVRATVLDVKNPAPPPAYNTAGPGKRWVRINIRLHSRSSSHFTQSTEAIQLVDSQGRRYHADGTAYEPSLGNGGVDLSKGDTVVGYEGYVVPKHAKLKEVRLSTEGGIGAPLIWHIG